LPEPSAFLQKFAACHDPKQALKEACGVPPPPHVWSGPMSPREVARELYAGSEAGIVPVDLLGQCLGHHHEFFQALANEFPFFFDFQNMNIVPAIRLYLFRFRLPGESDQIQRILEGFAGAYYAANNNKNVEKPPPGSLSSTRTDPQTRGWYVEPTIDDNGEHCCVHCGALESEVDGDLRACAGCNIVHFCRPCRYLAHRRGHAVVGMVGYGRACVQARRNAGTLEVDQETGMATMRFDRDGKSFAASEKVAAEYDWPRVSPFLSEDSVMVLAYSIIMLTTNLHNQNVRSKDRMDLHAFIQQCHKINDGTNFPGDMLAGIYADIRDEELKVVREAD